MRELQNAHEKANKNQRVKNHIFDLVLNLNSLDKNQQSLLSGATTSAATDIFNNFSGGGGPNTAMEGLFGSSIGGGFGQQ